MATRKQVEANRRNASRSTGPRTDEGKAASRLNATRHGIRASDPVVPHLERQEDWEAHRLGMVESLRPIGRLEEMLVERAAELSWRTNRVVQYERDEVAKAYSPEAPRYWHELREVGVAGGRQLPDLAKLGLLTRYEAHLHRSLMQLLRELQRIQDARRSQDDYDPVALDGGMADSTPPDELNDSRGKCETNPMLSLRDMKRS